MGSRRLLKAVQHLNRVPEVLRCQSHTEDWLRLTSAYVGLNHELPFEISLRSGKFEFLEASDIATFWQIFYRKVYPVKPSDFLIIDAGANIGAFTLYALETAPRARVVAIEPASDTCGRFLAMVRGNNLESRCTLHQAALSAHAGETTIELNAGSQFRRTGRNGDRVRAVTLESLLSPGQTVDLLKMDIEGAEYDVLRTLSAEAASRIRRIALEFHPNESYTSVVDALTAREFQLIRYRDDGAGYGMLWFERKRELATN